MDNKTLKIQRKSIQLICNIIIIFALFSSLIVHVVNGQFNFFLKTTDEFQIPNRNGSITFRLDGRYEKASLENNAWSFVNLQLNNTENEEMLSFKVLVTDCSIKISSIRMYNRTLGSETVKRARISYDTVGDGIQIFDLGLDPNRGDWGVRFDGVYVAENKGWSLSSQGVLTITGKASNISLSYYGLPDSFFNQSFINQHSVFIIVTFVTVFVVVISILIKLRKKSLEY